MKTDRLAIYIYKIIIILSEIYQKGQDEQITILYM